MQNDNITFCLPEQSIECIIEQQKFVAVAILLPTVAKYQLITQPRTTRAYLT